MDEDVGGDDAYERFWRVVPVASLPFPFHLFRCPFVERHLRALKAVGGRPDDYATPEQCSRAFRLFLTDVAAELTTCPYHQPDWNLATERAIDAVRRGPIDAGSWVTAETQGLDHETAWAAWNFFAEPIWINGDRLGNGQHRVCAMKCAGVLEAPIEESRPPRRGG